MYMYIYIYICMKRRTINKSVMNRMCSYSSIYVCVSMCIRRTCACSHMHPLSASVTHPCGNVRHMRCNNKETSQNRSNQYLPNVLSGKINTNPTPHSIQRRPHTNETQFAITEVSSLFLALCLPIFSTFAAESSIGHKYVAAFANAGWPLGTAMHSYACIFTICPNTYVYI